MRRVLMMAMAGAALAAATPALSAPTLHGFCAGNLCLDNGTNTPTTTNPPSFSFSASPGPATGILTVDILVPNNFAAPAPFTISGHLSGTATLFSSTAWTSGDLASYLGITASPTNPIGAYLPSTQVFDPTATGFWVFQSNLGTTTLPGNGGINDSYLITLGQGLAQGGYAVGFLNQGESGIGATANSGAIFETRVPVPEPATWAMMLLGFGGIGMAIRRSRRRSSALMQIA